MNKEVWNYIEQLEQKELTVEELTLLQEALLLHPKAELDKAVTKTDKGKRIQELYFKLDKLLNS